MKLPPTSFNKCVLFVVVALALAALVLTVLGTGYSSSSVLVYGGF